MSKMEELARLGQSVWYDYIRRAFITSGDLKFLIEEGLRGITSNPTIFEKAIAGSSDYDADLRRLMKEHRSLEKIFEALTFQDIGMAADLMREVYDATNGLDGYVSIEVNPHLAYDARQTIEEATRIFTTLKRPNVMIKVPATEPGLTAVQELLASGINVNVTLIFGLENYRQVAEAFIAGLEKLAVSGPSVRWGLTVSEIASVASVFVSRVDTAVDRELEERHHTRLQGKIAVANAKMIYQEFLKIFNSDRWRRLQEQGARKQRVLWASTSTKNPRYSPILYVQELIGPETVTTVPPATWEAFRRDGQIKETLTHGLEEAQHQLQELEELGISLTGITAQLQMDGVHAFIRSYENILRKIEEKGEKLTAGKYSVTSHLGKFQQDVRNTLREMQNKRVIRRIWEHDHTVWKPEPTEITNRLGWLHCPEKMRTAIREINDFTEELRRDGFTHALLLGMGGSSLAPEVFRKTFGVSAGYLDLSVLDSTDPGAVLEQASKLDPARTVYIVSTKSGGTVETLSFMKYFYTRLVQELGVLKAGQHFVAITDPGSGLEAMARSLNFRRIFLNDPNIGGRYSALSYFGLVPAGLIGMNLNLLLNRADIMLCNCEGCQRPGEGDNSCAFLGAALGELARQGKDKLTLILSPQIEHFGVWLEQLIAESTGKEGKGILPVVGEEVLTPREYSPDRLFVYMHLKNDTTHQKKVEALIKAGFPVLQFTLDDEYDLGGEIFRWELATAVAGWRLQINPFDQPNVESAKIRARQMVEAYLKDGKLPLPEPVLEQKGIRVFADFTPRNLSEALQHFLNQAEPGAENGSGRSYISLQAYLKPEESTDRELHALRTQLQKKYRMAVTVGYGPRFLHSTGQLHKGDAGHGLFIQFSADMPEDVPIPDEPGSEKSGITFGVLKTAQMLGDRQALKEANRKVMAFHFSGSVSDGIRKLTKLL